MRFKLDECVDVRLAGLFEAAGHNAETVFSEKVSGVAGNDGLSEELEIRRKVYTPPKDCS